MDGEKKIHWRNEAYWRLPENVRNAVDLANMKNKHTAFCQRLESLNDKIFVFRDVFYGRVPAYQKAFYEKKRKELEEELRLEKEKFEKEMNAATTKCKKNGKGTKVTI
jgi:hypothetical protein